MPNPCRVTGQPFTVASSATPLNCILYNAPTVTKITAATCIDYATGNPIPVTIANDAESFQVPINTPGKYVINATVNDTAGTTVRIVEDCPGHTKLLWITDKTANFILQVT